MRGAARFLRVVASSFGFAPHVTVRGRVLRVTAVVRLNLRARFASRVGARGERRDAARRAEQCDEQDGEEFCQTNCHVYDRTFTTRIKRETR